MIRDQHRLASSKSEALEIGAKTYYTGIPCKKGHDTTRVTSTGECLTCNHVRNNIRNGMDQHSDIAMKRAALQERREIEAAESEVWNEE